MLLHAAFVADEILGFMLEPARKHFIFVLSIKVSCFNQSLKLSWNLSDFMFFPPKLSNSRNSNPGSHSRFFTPLATTVRALHIYREKGSALSSPVESRRTHINHNRRQLLACKKCCRRAYTLAGIVINQLVHLESSKHILFFSWLSGTSWFKLIASSFVHYECRMQ